MSTITVTLFTDVHAQTMRAASLTIDEMAWHARVTTAAEKTSLPLWKLATFGKARTEHGSLRSDLNTIAITGVEADYNGEVVGIDEAVTPTWCHMSQCAGRQKPA